jgi:hypothetical protein
MLDKTIQDWSALATDLQIEGRAFINGRYEDALSGETRETASPANGRKLADVANCGIAGQQWRQPTAKWFSCAGRN